MIQKRTVLEDLERLLGFSPESDKIVRRAMRAYKASQTLANNKWAEALRLYRIFYNHLGHDTFSRIIKESEGDKI